MQYMPDIEQIDNETDSETSYEPDSESESTRPLTFLVEEKLDLPTEDDVESPIIQDNSPRYTLSAGRYKLLLAHDQLPYEWGDELEWINLNNPAQVETAASNIPYLIYDCTEQQTTLTLYCGPLFSLNLDRLKALVQVDVLRISQQNASHTASQLRIDGAGDFHAVQIDAAGKVEICGPLKTKQLTIKAHTVSLRGKLSVDHLVIQCESELLIGMVGQIKTSCQITANDITLQHYLVEQVEKGMVLGEATAIPTDTSPNQTPFFICAKKTFKTKLFGALCSHQPLTIKIGEEFFLSENSQLTASRLLQLEAEKAIVIINGTLECETLSASVTRWAQDSGKTARHSVTTWQVKASDSVQFAEDTTTFFKQAILIEAKLIVMKPRSQLIPETVYKKPDPEAPFKRLRLHANRHITIEKDCHCEAEQLALCGMDITIHKTATLTVPITTTQFPFTLTTEDFGHKHFEENDDENLANEAKEEAPASSSRLTDNAYYKKARENAQFFAQHFNHYVALNRRDETERGQKG